MKRLTQHTAKGASLILDNPKNEIEARKQLMDKFKIAVEKLATYEDTGLEPFEVATLKAENEKLKIALSFACKDWDCCGLEKYDRSSIDAEMCFESYTNCDKCRENFFKQQAEREMTEG